MRKRGGGERIEGSLIWQETGKFTHHKECSFLFTTAKDGLILPFALCVWLKAGENGEFEELTQ